MSTLTRALLLTLALAPACKPTESLAPAPAPAPPATATQTKGERPEDRGQADPDGVIRRGEPLSTGEPITVADAQALVKTKKPEGLVKVSGTVDKVCAKKGCWFELVGEGKNMRITSKGYKFFVPDSASGKTAIVEGELTASTIDQATAQHYEDDKAEGTGQPAKKIEGPVEELAIVAVGLELK